MTHRVKLCEGMLRARLPVRGRLAQAAVVGLAGTPLAMTFVTLDHLVEIYQDPERGMLLGWPTLVAQLDDEIFVYPRAQRDLEIVVHRGTW